MRVHGNVRYPSWEGKAECGNGNVGEDLILPRFVEAAKFWLTELRILRKYQSQSFQLPSNVWNEGLSCSS